MPSLCVIFFHSPIITYCSSFLETILRALSVYIFTYYGKFFSLILVKIKRHVLVSSIFPLTLFWIHQKISYIVTPFYRTLAIYPNIIKQTVLVNVEISGGILERVTDEY